MGDGDSKDARRCPTTIGPSCNTDQGVQRTCECYGNKPNTQSESNILNNITGFYRVFCEIELNIV